MWLVLGIIIAIIGIVFIFWLTSKTNVNWGKGLSRFSYVLALIPAAILGGEGKDTSFLFGFIMVYVISLIVLKIILWVFGGFKKK